MDWHDVGGEEDQARGSLRRVEIGGRGVALVRTDRGYSALDDACPHAGAPLSAGVLREGFVVCSWHGWKFDAATGVCPLFPGAPPAGAREVRVEGGRVLVAG